MRGNGGSALPQFEVAGVEREDGLLERQRGERSWPSPLRESVHEGSQPVNRTRHQAQGGLCLHYSLGPQILQGIHQKPTARMDTVGY